MIMTVYIQAGSKAQVQRDIKAGKNPTCEIYNLFEGDRTCPWVAVPEGAVVKIYSELVDGIPYAKAYGNKKNGKLV